MAESEPGLSDGVRAELDKACAAFEKRAVAQYGPDLAVDFFHFHSDWIGDAIARIKGDGYMAARCDAAAAEYRRREQIQKDAAEQRRLTTLHDSKVVPFSPFKQRTRA